MTTVDKSLYLTSDGHFEVLGIFDPEYHLCEIKIALNNNDNLWTVSITESEPELIRLYMGIKQAFQKLDGYSFTVVPDEKNMKMMIWHCDQYIGFDKNIYMIKQ